MPTTLLSYDDNVVHSWGESLNEYRKVHHNQTSTCSPQYQPVYRYSRNRSIEWRTPVINTVTQQHCDVELENKCCQQEENKRKKQIESARVKQLKCESGFDLVTMSLKPGAEQVKPELKPRPKTTGSIKRQHPSDECKNDFDSLFGTTKQLSKFRTRTDFDPITLGYKNDRKRKRQERKKEHQRIIEKYIQTKRDYFNPVLQRWEDAEKERNFIITRRNNLQKTQHIHQKIIPPSIKNADSAAYDPFTSTIKNRELYQKTYEPIVNGSASLLKHISNTKRLSKYVKQTQKHQHKFEKKHMRRFKAPKPSVEVYNVVTGDILPVNNCKSSIWQHATKEPALIYSKPKIKTSFAPNPYFKRPLKKKRNK